MAQTEYLFSSEQLGFRLLEDTDIESLKRLDMDPEVRAHFPDGVLTSEEIKQRVSTNWCGRVKISSFRE
jgi:hypothetical protein